jgi:hypothetical protein
VSKIEEDDIDSIYKAAFECARTYSYGGGIGVDISCLRPRDAIVHNAADSSTGAVSFMELFSLTTGLIGQSGRRGALMLTIDVKHPDVMHFIKVKKTPNWVTNQIVEQCKWSGLFDETKLEAIKKQVMENIQVRFANISIKASNEFMHAVDEQRHFSEDTYLVYKKKNKDIVTQARYVSSEKCLCSSTACMNSLLALIDIFANRTWIFSITCFFIASNFVSSNKPDHLHCSTIWFVTQLGVFLTLIKCMTSGCLTSMVSINAPRRPLCPINPVVSENNSINDTAPVELSAALCTIASRGLKQEISTPMPPP